MKNFCVIIFDAIFEKTYDVSGYNQNSNRKQINIFGRNSFPETLTRSWSEKEKREKTSLSKNFKVKKRRKTRKKSIFCVVQTCFRYLIEYDRKRFARSFMSATQKKRKILERAASFASRKKKQNTTNSAKSRKYEKFALMHPELFFSFCLFGFSQFLLNHVLILFSIAVFFCF